MTQYKKIIDFNDLEIRQSDNECIALENAVLDYGDWQEENLFAMTLKSDYLEIGFVKDDVLVFKTDADIDSTCVVLADNDGSNPIRCVKMYRTLYSDAELVTK